MNTSVVISLNGVPLNEVHSSIILSKVDELPIQMDRSMSSRSGDGQDITRSVRKYLAVRVSFQIAIRKNDITTRYAVLDAVRKWAMNGGELTVNYRSGKHLSVVCETQPAVGYIRDWVNTYVIEFRAYGVPYWEADSANTIAANAISSELELENVGTSATPLSFTLLNNSANTINAVHITANGYDMVFSSLGMVTGETLRVSYVAGRQTVDIIGVDGDTRGAYGKRTAESADDVWLLPGINTVEVSSSARGRYTLSCVGRFD